MSSFMPPSSRGDETAAQTQPVYTKEPGDYSDVCPLCGIHRQNAGFLRETCGDGFLKPGCFIKEAEPNG